MATEDFIRRPKLLTRNFVNRNIENGVIAEKYQLQLELYLFYETNFKVIKLDLEPKSTNTFNARKTQMP